MRKKILSVLQYLCLCVVLSAGMVLTGCTKDNSGGTVGDTSATAQTTTPTAASASSSADAQPPGPPEPRDGGTLRLAMRAPLTLNPLLNEDVTVDRILKLIFEPLTTLNDQLKPVSNLVTMNFSSDYASVSLTLRSDIIWSDGTPITADDIIFSIGVLRDAPDTAIYKHQVDNVANCEKLDNKTVKITFVEIFSGSGYLFNFPIIPQHYYKNENNPASEKNMAPLGNGLFMFDTYTAMKQMTLKQSPYSHRKRAYIEQVEILVMADTQTALHAFDQGLIDVISMELTEWSRHHSVKQTHYGEYAAMYYDFIGFNFDEDSMNDVESMDEEESMDDGESTNGDESLDDGEGTDGDESIDDGESTVDAESMNDADDTNSTSDVDDVIGKNVMSDKRLREAIARCIDVDTLVPAIYLQHAVRTKSPVNPASWLYDAETPVYAYDLEAAKTLVDQVKKTRKIPPLRVLVNEENDERSKIAEALVEGMTELGLEVTLEQVPFEDFARRLAAGDYDIFIGGYNLSVIPDITFAFHTDAIATGSNLLSYSDAALDRLLRLAFSAGTEDAYMQALSQVQRRIAEELPVISLAFRQSAVLTDTRIYGDIKPSTDNIFANVNEWFIVDAQ